MEGVMRECERKRERGRESGKERDGKGGWSGEGLGWNEGGKGICASFTSGVLLIQGHLHGSPRWYRGT